VAFETSGRTEIEDCLVQEEDEVMKRLMGCVVRFHNDEAGQGLVEYLLILALVAFAATAGMRSLAEGLNSAFTKVSSIVGQYIS
jgi:pilus assembly protein Flp/PilA